MTIDQYASNLINIDLMDLVKESLIENEDSILFMNQMQLYNESEDQKGVKLMSYNSILYALWKNQRNKGPGLMHPDLYDTGAFYRAFHLEVKKDTFEIDSTDPKSGDLKEKYGEDIFGLNEEHLRILAIEYVQEDLMKKILG